MKKTAGNHTGTPPLLTYFLTSILFILICIDLSAQVSSSPKKLLEDIWAAGLSEDSLMDSSLNILKRKYKSIDPVAFNMYAERTQSLAKDLNALSTVVEILDLRGKHAYFKLEDYPKAITFLDEAKFLNQSLNDNYRLCVIQINRGNALRRMGQYIAAIEALEHALTLFDTLNEFQQTKPIQYYSSRGTVHLNLGLCYKNVGELQTALVHFLQNLFYKKKTRGNSPRAYNDIAKAHNSLIPIYRDLQRLDSAWLYSDSTRNLFNKGLANDSSILADNYMLEGSLLELDKNYKKALFLYQDALAIYKSEKSNSFTAKCYEQIGHVHVMQGHNKLASQALTSAYQLIKDGDDYKLIDDVCESLSQVYTYLGKTKLALTFLQKSKAARNQIYNAENQLLAVKQIQLKTDEAEKHKMRLNLIERDQKIKIFLLYSAILIVGIFAIVSLLGLRYYRKSNRVVIENLIQKETLHHQHVIQLLKDQELEINSALLAGQDQERERISSELHDNLSGTLAGGKKLFEFLMHHLSGDKKQELKDLTKEIIKMLDKAYNQAHDLSEDMANSFKPDTLGGFAAQIQNSMEKLQILEIETDLQTAGDLSKKLRPQATFDLRRIVEEAFTNIIKYAKAEKVSVRLDLQQDGLNLLIQDNGEGFDPQQIQEGLGLSNMRKRARKLGANLTIDTSPGHGTRILAHVARSDLEDLG